jgi:hypothetical protein
VKFGRTNLSLDLIRVALRLQDCGNHWRCLPVLQASIQKAPRSSDCDYFGSITKVSHSSCYR